jgi:hypothetical protein
MSPVDPQEENGWAEYRRLVLSWHDDDVRERREIRERLEKHQEEESIILRDINNALAELKFQSKALRWIGGVGVPAFVALLVAYISHRLGI